MASTPNGSHGAYGAHGVHRAQGARGAHGGVGRVGGVNLLALRSHNGALVLDLLRRAGPYGISRLELADRTGLTPQAVSKITARLRADGLVTEAGRRASTGGKPPTVLRLVPDAGHAVGLHLDRDELRVVLCDLTGAVVAQRRTPLSLGAGADAVIEGAAREVEVLLEEAHRELLDSQFVGGEYAAGEFAGDEYGGEQYGGGELEAGGETGGETVGGALAGGAPVGGDAESPFGRPPLSLLGVGVALPGPLDHLHGVLHRVTGFPEWEGFPLRAVLARRLGVPVVVDKDTNAAALGLAAVAGPLGAGTFAYLHLSTGLGAGLVIDGHVHRGARTRAGEFGHQIVQLDGPLCACGNRGCIEALCLAAVRRGDVEAAARVLGAGAANLVGLLDIELVLLGGRTVEAYPDVFVRGVGAVLDEWARRQGSDPAVPVRVASGGASGVAEGAAQLMLAPLFGRAD